jgi:hypothetical protein
LRLLEIQPLVDLAAKYKIVAPTSSRQLQKDIAANAKYSQDYF